MSPTHQSRWSLNAQAFERLLGHLDPNREAASHEYERLRRRLIDFFDWRGVPAPEARADETLDRVAQKLEAGAAIERVGPYALGVARHILLESYRRGSREAVALEEIRGRTPAPDPASEGDDRLACLQRCLRNLPEDHRTLILAYYEGDGRAHLVERKSLAQRLGLSYGALRLRAHRVRGLIQECLQGCLAGANLGNETTAGGH